MAGVLVTYIVSGSDFTNIGSFTTGTGACMLPKLGCIGSLNLFVKTSSCGLLELLNKLREF